MTHRVRAVVPLALMALGSYGAWQALRYGLWSDAGPGAGLLPAIASVALCAFAAIALRERTVPAGDAVHLPRLAGYVAGLAGFALLMGPLGAPIAIVSLFAWVLGVVERWPLRRVVPSSLAAALFAWVLFERLLRVPLPHGTLFG